MAKDDLAASGRIEVVMLFGSGVVRRHLRLSSLVGSQGAQTKADCEASEAERAGRQPEG